MGRQQTHKQHTVLLACAIPLQMSLCVCTSLPRFYSTYLEVVHCSPIGISSHVQTCQLYCRTAVQYAITMVFDIRSVYIFWAIYDMMHGLCLWSKVGRRGRHKGGMLVSRSKRKKGVIAECAFRVGLNSTATLPSHPTPRCRQIEQQQSRPEIEYCPWRNSGTLLVPPDIIQVNRNDHWCC